MSTLIQPTIFATPTAVVNASTIATVAVPLAANTVYIVDVVQRHTTPASLGTVTLSGSTTGTWTQLATVTFGGASPTTRQTRFGYVGSTDITGEVLTATASASQTGIGMRGFVFGGHVSTNLAAACRQTVVANSGGASVLTMAPGPVLAALGAATNGVFVGFASNAGSVTKKSAYTEITQLTMPAGTIYEAQFLGSNDTTPNVTQASNQICGIATEIVAIPHPVVFSFSTSAAPGVVGFGTGVPFSVPFGVTFRAGRVVIIGVEIGSSSTADPGFSTITFPTGVTGGQIASCTAQTPVIANGRFYSVVYMAWATGPDDLVDIVSLSFLPASTGTVEIVAQVIEVQCDVTKGAHGLIQVAAVGQSTNLALSPSLVTFGSLQNAALVAGMAGGNNSVPFATAVNTMTHGFAAIVSPTFSQQQSVQFFQRPNAPVGVTANPPSSTGAAMVVMEFAAVPTNSPAVALVSPANGSTIAQGATITIDATDVDGDLTTVSITANGETVTATGTTLPSPYSGGAISTITGGKEFAFPRSGGFAVGPLGVSGVATDSQGHTTPFSFAWTVAAPVTHFPSAALVSPSQPGPILGNATITIDFLDLDDDLSTFSILANGETVTVAGVSLVAPYAGSISGITHGSRAVFSRAGGFALGTLGVSGVVTDSLGHVTPFAFAWTVGITSFPDPVISRIDVLGPGGLLFQVDERTAAVWHLDEPDGVQPSDEAANVIDLSGIASLPLPVRAAGIVGHGRKWASPHGLAGKDAVVDATALARTMALEIVVFAQGDGTRYLLQRGLNDGTAPERILWGLHYVVSGGTGTLQMVWQKASGASATVPGQTFAIPTDPPSPWLYLAAVRRWVSTAEVHVDYYVNGTLIGSTTSTDGDLPAGSGGTVLIGVNDGAGTPATGMLTGDIIDEVRVSKGERTAEELRQVFRRLFVVPGWARDMLRAFLPPGQAYSLDPSSGVQREIGVEGDGLAHAWHLADELLDDWFPDRATQTLERWEGLTRLHPHPDDFYADRRARVVGQLSSIQGFSRQKIAEAIAPLLGVGVGSIVFVENSNRFADTFAAALGGTWIQEPHGGTLAVAAGALTASFAAAADARSDATHDLGIRARRGLPDWNQAEAYAKVTARSLTNAGDLAGLTFWEWTTHDRTDFGIRWTGAAYEWGAQAVIGGVYTSYALGAPAPPAPPFYLRLRHNGDGTFDGFYSTAGYDGPWILVADNLPSAAEPQWAGVELVGGTSSAGAGSSASFDEFRAWAPNSLDVFRWFVTSSPPPAPSVNLRAVQQIVDGMTPAHTQGIVFGTLFLCDDPNSTTDNTLLGS